jgi:hypothetical protein
VAHGFTVQAAGVVDLDVLRIPVEAHRRVTLVVAVHDRIEQQFAHGGLGVVGLDLLTQGGNEHRALPQMGVDQQVQRLQHGHQVAFHLLGVDHFTGRVFAGQAQELDIGTRQVLHRPMTEQQHPGMAGAGPSRVVEAQAGQLLLDAATVGGNHVFGDDAAPVADQESVQVQVVQCGGDAGLGVEAARHGHPALQQHPLFLLAGNGLARADAYPYLALVTHRRQVGGMHLDHGHVPPRECTTTDVQHRQRLHVAIGAQGAQVLEQLIGHLQSAGPALIVHTDQQITGLPMPGQIVGEGTNGLGELVGVVGGHRALDAVGLQVLQQGQNNFSSRHGGRPSSGVPSNRGTRGSHGSWPDPAPERTGGVLVDLFNFEHGALSGSAARKFTPAVFHPPPGCRV